MKKVVIIGGGFGGLKAAKVLGTQADLQVVLVDRRNYHLFQPLLYQVATAALSPADIATPIRSILSVYPNTSVILAEVQSVDLAKKELSTETGTISFDYLIMACGASHGYFGHEDWEEHAPGLKTLEQATEIRRRVLLALETAECETDEVKRDRLLTFVVVGAGPTGVELAGALAEICRYTLSRDFKHIDPKRTQVVLIEAGPRILASFSEKLSLHAARDLEKLGVQIRTSTAVTSITTAGVHFGDVTLPSATMLWAAGVYPSSLGKTLGVPLDRAGRVIIGPDLSVPDYPFLFVVGDQACFLGTDGKPLPGVAPVAMQQGLAAAGNIVADLRGTARTLFRYHDKGQMATIGRKKAIVQKGNMQFGGLFAWLAWLLVHIFYLIGFRNRLFVLMSWGWAYMTFSRGARLIVNKEWRLHSKDPREE